MGEVQKQESRAAQRRRLHREANENRASFTSLKLDVQSCIISDPAISRAAKLVAVYLLSCLNSETGQCNPSHDTIADVTTMSKPTVERAIKDLKDAGWLSAKRRNRQSSNSYHFPDNTARANAILDRQASLRDDRSDQRRERAYQLPSKKSEPSHMRVRDFPEPSPVMGPEPSPVMGKHLKGTPKKDSLPEERPGVERFHRWEVGT